jgi:hypothetical protein
MLSCNLWKALAERSRRTEHNTRCEKGGDDPQLGAQTRLDSRRPKVKTFVAVRNGASKRPRASMSRDCPQCALVSPDEALRCDCGYDFATNTIESSYLIEHHRRKQLSSGAHLQQSSWPDSGFVWAVIGILGAANIVAIAETGNASLFLVTLGFMAVALRRMRPGSGDVPEPETNDDSAEEDIPEPAGAADRSAEFALPRALCFLTVQVPEQPARDMVAWLPAQWRATKTLSPEHIVGRLLRARADGGKLTAENFIQNPVLALLLHDFLQRELPTRASLHAAARRQKDGWLSLVDQRVLDAPARRQPLAEDVIGVIEVRGGQVVPGSYRGNPAHRLLTAKGIFQLEYALQERLKREIAARHVMRGAGDPPNSFVM